MIFVWLVEGIAENLYGTGAVVRAFSDTGQIEAEHAGEALDWLNRKGPLWDSGLDANQRFTLTIWPEPSKDDRE
jgi:hypothetical protein